MKCDHANKCSIWRCEHFTNHEGMERCFEECKLYPEAKCVKIEYGKGKIKSKKQKEK